jgi:L-iditol 2-dehydrogenase
MTRTETTAPNVANDEFGRHDDLGLREADLDGEGGLMDALVLRAPGEVSIEQVPVPVPGRNEVLCRVRSIAICGTDAHIIGGDFPGFWPPTHPFIPGHEWAGDVVAVGPGASAFGWAVGARVAGSSHAGCGYCRNCQIGRYNLCENYGNAEVHSQYGHTTQGAYAQYVVHSIKSLTPIPDDMSYDVATMLDTASIALHTVNRARTRPGEAVAVLGAGVMGMLLAECARASGAGRVIVVGRGPRLRRAVELGHEIVDTAEGDPVAEVRRRTHGFGVQTALESAGVAETLRWALAMLRKGGTCSVIGIPLEEVALPIQSLVLNEFSIVGVRANAGEMADVVPLVASGRVRADALITHRFPLTDFDEAYRVFTQRVDGALKVILHP